MFCILSKFCPLALAVEGKKQTVSQNLLVTILAQIIDALLSECLWSNNKVLQKLYLHHLWHPILLSNLSPKCDVI